MGLDLIRIVIASIDAVYLCLIAYQIWLERFFVKLTDIQTYVTRFIGGAILFQLVAMICAFQRLPGVFCLELLTIFFLYLPFLLLQQPSIMR